jgi:rhodanese-related sulfurtransferase
MGFKVVDVRTPEEFAGGNVVDSINIPLDKLVEREEEVLAIEELVVFCCLSGGRSEQATQYFKSKGLNCVNGGGWMEVNGNLDKY